MGHPGEFLVAGENQENDVSGADSAGVGSSAVTGTRAYIKLGAARGLLDSQLSPRPFLPRGILNGNFVFWHGSFCCAASSNGAVMNIRCTGQGRNPPQKRRMLEETCHKIPAPEIEEPN
jgi:hypothetical protein